LVPKELLESLREKVAQAVHPYEQAVDVMNALQKHYGWLNDEALGEAARILGMTPLELEELATFYDFIYREPVGKYVIRVCDSVVCWMHGHESMADLLSKTLGIGMGETTTDGLFTLLPTCCIGYCDRAPAMLVNGKVYGSLTLEKVQGLIEKLKTQSASMPRDE
jgi:NADH-quinone oxidoreductase subunit E